MTLDHPERWAKGKVQSQLLLDALRSYREALEQLQSFREVTDRFTVRRAFNGMLAGAVPVGDGLCTLLCLCVVLRQ
jgi:hypothetical protein